MNFMEKVFVHFASRYYFNWMPDKLFIKLNYRCRFGKKLDLDNPRTYNEKLQWLKLYDRDPKHTELVDKYEVRKFIKDKIGEQYLIPLIGVWDSVEDIDFDKLPEQFVLKCTHDSGGVIICRDRSQFNVEEAKKKLSYLMKRNFYKLHREWPYKNVKHRIIAEKYMVDESGTQLKDYKFFCFNGEPKMMFVATDRNIDTRFDFYDMEFKHMDFKNGHENADKHIEKPTGFEEMKRLAAILSKGIAHVRVDFYDINGKVYFGEMTFFHWSGYVPFEPESYDYMLGEWIELPKKFKNTKSANKGE